MRVLLVCLSVLCIPFVGLAQGLPGGFSGGITGLDQFLPQNTLVVSPPHPEPGQTVVVSVDDYSGGGFGSQITWRLNGETIDIATNRRNVQFTAGLVGTTDVVEAVLESPQGITQVLREEVTPVYLDVILEPQTRVPDWYQGRSMPTIGSQINATALVNDGSFIDPAALVYTWRVNRNVLDAGPVRARNRMSFATPRGEDFLLSVSVSRLNGEVVASKVFEVLTSEPTLRFYEQHSLFGSKQSPVGASLPVSGNTVTLLAEPYHLDSRVYNNPDVATWEIDRIETSNGSRNPYEITLQSGSRGGQTSVNFHVRSLQEVLQGSEDTILIDF